MTTRTDIHRPSAITPEDYSFIGCDYYGPNYGENLDRQFIRKHMDRTGGKYSTHHHGGSCHVCGASAMYVAIYHHAKTNTYIVTGEDCASKMDTGEAIAFRSLRKRIAAERKADKGVKKAVETLKAANLTAAWEIYKDANRVDKYEENTIRDIVSKLVRYGTISEKAEGFMRSLIEKIAKRAEIEAERARATEAALPVPMTDARILIKGKVLSVKVVDGYYGRQTKILVQHADGWKIWGTAPCHCDRGDEIEFCAKIERSDKDEKFGFFSRPTKPRIISSALVTEMLADTTWGVIIGHKDGLSGTISGKTKEQAQVTFDEACEIAGNGHLEYVLLTHGGNTVDGWGT